MKLAVGFTAGLVVGSTATVYYMSLIAAPPRITDDTAVGAEETRTCTQISEDVALDMRDSKQDINPEVAAGRSPGEILDTLSENGSGWRWSPSGACGAGTEAQQRVVNAFNSSAR